MRALRPVVAVLLPFFFASAGLTATRPDNPAIGWSLAALFVVVAVSVRVIAYPLVRRLTTISARDVRTVQTLNCARGATEILLLQLGRSFGLISPLLYFAMLIAAVVTTVASAAITPGRPIVAMAPARMLARRALST